MGSAAPLPDGLDAARDVLAELERQARLSIQEEGEPNTAKLLACYDLLTANHPQRDEVRAFVMAYLVKCLLGVTPDYRRWTPFS
jgi:hypothetical protein